MSFPRSSGILLHPTSLPSRGGIGDFGPAAYAFADFLSDARQSLWQVLPLSPVGDEDSPYSATSAFAGNPLLISLERLAEHGWIEHARIEELPTAVADIEYKTVFHQKLPVLFEAARNFVRTASWSARARYDAFCQQNRWWLDDFVLFDGLRARFKPQGGTRWPRGLTTRAPAAIKKVQEEMHEDLEVRRVVQFFFCQPWRALRA